MIYIINLLAVAAIPLAMGGNGANLAAKILDSEGWRKALVVISASRNGGPWEVLLATLTSARCWKNNPQPILTNGG
jgi:hypothetical protein